MQAQAERGVGISPGPGALVNANVDDACTASYYNPFYATKMHKIAPFSLGVEKYSTVFFVFFHVTNS